MTTKGLTETLDRLGHLAPRRQLAELGFGRVVVDRHLRAGHLLAVRPGWVATAESSQTAVIATLRGARLTGCSALRSYGIWAGSDRRLHLQLPRNAHRVHQQALTPLAHFTPPRFAPTGIIEHWSVAAANPTRYPQWRVAVTDALRCFATREPAEQVAAVIESAVHEHRLSRTEAHAFVTTLPRRLLPLARKLNFLAESGLETIARLRLEDRGIRGTQQQWIAQDRVDLVIDGWLVIEWDGDAWHDPARDRIRTNRLIRAGYRVLRFGYFDVIVRWEETLATILELLGAGATRSR